jgi:hypothetical protein
VKEIKTFRNPGQALAYMVECTMASLEHMREVKRTAKYEIERHESIVAIGMQAISMHVNHADVHSARCHRVLNRLVEMEIQKM